MKIKWKKVLVGLSILFVLTNGAAYYHAWHIVHFCKADGRKFVPPDKMTFSAKASALLTGIYNPKSVNDSLPSIPYQTINLTTTGGNKLEAWDIPANENKGTVMVLHGFKGCKSSMLPVVNYFHQLGMNCFAIDFSGHGNSDGNSSTVGYYEAKDVEVAYQYIKLHHTGPLVVFGSSMGAVSALHAVSQYGIQPDKMILEAPFGSMLQATRNRFDMQGVPTFPLAQIVVFWGGVQQGFWPFNHNPTEYAKQVNMPVLLMYGVNDKKVSMTEVQSIFANLHGEKSLHLFQHSGHTNYLENEATEWRETVGSFMDTPAIAEGK